MELTAASSLGQGLTHCNNCGECCASPCLLKDDGDVVNLAEFLGKTKLDMLDSLSITKGEAGIFVRPRVAKGRCEFHNGDGCSVHATKPSGGVDFECWNAERTAKGRTAMFVWSEADLMACIASARSEA